MSQQRNFFSELKRRNVYKVAVAYAAIAWLLRYVSTHSFAPFVIYRIALAGVVVVLLLTGVLEPLPASSGPPP